MEETINPIRELFDKLPRIIIPPKTDLEVELRFIIDGRKPAGVSTKTYSAEQTVEIAKRFINKFKDKPQSIEQSINLITKNELIKQLKFIRGVQQKGQESYYKKSKIIEPVYFLHNELPAYRLNISFETKVEEFKVSDALARIKLRYSITLDNWRLDITLIKNVETFSNPGRLKEAKDKLLFDIDLTNFVEKAPWKHIDYIEFELEYIGNIKAISLQSLEIANQIFDDQLKTASNIIVGEVSKYQSLLYQVATYIKPKSAAKFKTKDGMKQLSNQVIELDKNIYLRDVAKKIKDYYITDKLDGQRAIVYLSPDESYALTDKEQRLDIDTKELYIFDTEFYKDRYYVFDVLAWKDEVLVDKPFEERMKYFEAAKEQFPSIIMTKPFIRLDENYKAQLREFKKEKKPYDVDGIVMTPYDGIYETMVVFKYKPIKLLSTDFLIRKCPTRLLGIKPYLNQPNKTLYILFCGISRNVYFQLNMRLINRYDDIFTGIDMKRLPAYFPIQFQPSNKTYAYLFWSDQDSLDNKVGEFVYHSDEWHLHRIRDDRQVEVNRGNYFGNNYKVVELNWMSYQDPLVIEDLDETSYSYFQDRDDKLQKNTRNFNSFVKSTIFKQFRNTEWIIDIASGKGQDLFRYASVGTRHLVCLEIDKIALFELIYRKHDFGNQSGFGKNKTKSSMNVIAHQLDMNENYQTNIDMLNMDISIPAHNVNLIVCNFAFHYFLKDRKALTNVVKFINHYLAPGGRFVFTSFDGAAIIRLLNDNNGNWTVSNDDGKTAYSIRKQYEVNYLEPIGQTIEVLLPFSNERYYQEYLVNIDYITTEFTKAGFTLELDQSFSEYLNDYKRSNKEAFAALSENDKKYIDLYHYYCFYKKASIK